MTQAFGRSMDSGMRHHSPLVESHPQMVALCGGPCKSARLLRWGVRILSCHENKQKFQILTNKSNEPMGVVGLATNNSDTLFEC